MAAMRIAYGLALVGVATAGPATAAEMDGTGEPARPKHTVELGVGAQSALAFGDICYGHSDVLECSPGFFMNGFHVAPRWRASPSFSVGLLGSVSWVSNIGYELHTYWAAEAEGRWHPVVGSNVDPWFGIDAGLMTIVDRYDRTDFFSEQKFVHSSPMLGIGAGIEFQLASILAMGPALRGFMILSDDGRTVGSVVNRAPRYSTQFGVGLAVSGTFLVGDSAD